MIVKPDSAQPVSSAGVSSIYNRRVPAIHSLFIMPIVSGVMASHGTTASIRSIYGRSAITENQAVPVDPSSNVNGNPSPTLKTSKVIQILSFDGEVAADRIAEAGQLIKKCTQALESGSDRSQLLF